MNLKELIENVKQRRRINDETEWFDDEAMPTDQYNVTHDEWMVYVPLMEAHQVLVDYVLANADKFIACDNMHGLDDGEL